ncbi:MAG: HAD family hydrolase [Geminicoccaceae bacterium]
MVGAQEVIGRPIELVIFDCDGVLIDSEVIATRATVEVLAEIGYEISEADALQDFVGKSYATIMGQIEADWGRALPASFNADLERMALGIMKEELQPIPGIARVLKQLRLSRCVASNSSLEWIRLGLERTGLFDDLTPHLFSASMVENGKPAPDIFLHAARQMGVLPERVVVVEDSLAGVQAGAAAGMAVIGFTGGSHIVGTDHGGELRAAGAGHIIDDMAMLPALLAPLT